MDSHETTLSDPIDGVILKVRKRYSDDRGWLIEIFREDELPVDNTPRMAYVSETLPGLARGPHAHREQSDLFAFFGPGDFRLYFWDSREHSPTFGNHAVVTVGESNPQIVIIPPGVVHAYKNISSIPGLVINAPNRLYAGEGRREPVDEIRYEDLGDSPYALT